ncbi:NADH-quinone oxidoreductase subunit J [Psychrobacter frigidicola]|uniref:NADH-quinone oxidoreductase subunit J n=1 Tax=Psychrobacter frigidicola TaxID=45611 RepID=A0A5C7A6K5_9GAMM|nr:NADH-quinone oxidoreductase subunit J [Psychrobacter frigidicola]TXD97456.1 NADH-quinone oxidoreductase subunit J [Psychrobacter frigidicola]
MMTVLNNPDLVGFYALAAVAIFASLRVVMHPNPVHAILAMIVSLLAVAGILFILGAPFAGALEIVVYAGAILILFVFVIMMLNLGMANEAREESWLNAKTWAVPTGLTIIIAVVLYALIGLNDNEAAVIGGITVPAKAVGTVLFSKYIMLVEVAALLLLAALVAAYHLGKESLNDEITTDNNPDIDRRADGFKDYLLRDNGIDSTIQTPEPYEYKDVDPHDYVGIQKVTRKESD